MLRESVGHDRAVVAVAERLAAVHTQARDRNVDPFGVIGDRGVPGPEHPHRRLVQLRLHGSSLPCACSAATTNVAPCMNPIVAISSSRLSEIRSGFLPTMIVLPFWKAA